jgi:hypothetical protein
MADNVIIPATGSGTATPEIATDDVGGAHYQRVKLDVGGDGVSVPVEDFDGNLPVVITETANVGIVSSAITLPIGIFDPTNSNQADVTVAGRLKVEAHDGGSTLSVDDGGGALTVDGTVGVTDNGGSLTVDGTVSVNTLPAGDNNIGDVDVLSLPALPAGTNAIGKLAANSGVDIGDVDVTSLPALPAGNNNIGDVDIASSVVLTTKQAASTGTLANVASSATSVTVLASNAARLGATIHNDSTEILYVKFGTTASATSYTVKMVADAYYEVPFGYTGRIDGIWANANGNARVTELT